MSVSLLSSRWIQVVPDRYGRQENWYPVGVLNVDSITAIRLVKIDWVNKPLAALLSPQALSSLSIIASLSTT